MNGRAYYNEIDPYAAQWLRNLIGAGHIPAGDVDERSIVDVQPDDLRGYTQCHFFAGIGGWAYAARLAGWPDDRQLWTGSCPCQPFSVAGKQRGADDERHLWPHFFRLIASHRPAAVMGEQVAAAVGKGWIDGVFADLEGIGYACEAAIAPACAVNAPHRRDRLWFVADANRNESGTDGRDLAEVRGVSETECRPEHGSAVFAGSGSEELGPMADANSAGLEGRQPMPERGSERATWASCVANTSTGRGSSHELCTRRNELGIRRAWSDIGWIIGHDGKARRVEPSIRLLANGVPARVGRLRAYGNAIVPQVASEVIGAYMETT